MTAEQVRTVIDVLDPVRRREIALEKLPRLLDQVCEQIREVIKTSSSPEEDVKRALDDWSVPALGLKASALMPCSLIEVEHKAIKKMIGTTCEDVLREG